ncbi:MAG: PHP domain-containing protein [bacterium]
MFKIFNADLHIHTCLSPCSDLDMTPKRIINEVKLKYLDIIGICDHNSCENVIITKEIANIQGIKVIGGIEITSSEEVHILALFDNDEELLKLQEIVYENLDGINDEKAFGTQLVVNEHDEVVAHNKKLLIGATKLPVKKWVDLVHSLNGLVIASHIDREGFGIIGQLGFIPDDLKLDGLEISPKITFKEAKVTINEANNFPVITGSDAHHLEDIGISFTRFLIKEPSVKEIKMALVGEEGRKILKS